MGGSVRNTKVRRIHWMSSAFVVCLAAAPVPVSVSRFRPRGEALTSAGPRQSSAVALTADDNTLVNVNPESNTVTVFSVSSDTPTKLAEIPVGRDPSSVAIAPGGERAYVTNALDGTLSVVRLQGAGIYT